MGFRGDGHTLHYQSHMGELGIVDQASQSSSLLGKFIVHGLLPCAELHRFWVCSLSSGGPWQPEIRWNITEMYRAGSLRRVKSRFRGLQSRYAQHSFRHHCIVQRWFCISHWWGTTGENRETIYGGFKIAYFLGHCGCQSSSTALKTGCNFDSFEDWL